MVKKKTILSLFGGSQVNKVLANMEETLNDINAKLDELRELDKGSKFLAILGWLLMGFSGGGMLTIAVMFKQRTSLTDYAIVFFLSSIIVTLMITGFALAHKGLTGDWL
jgi:predicted esterase